MANFNYVTGKIYWAKVFNLVPNYNRDGYEYTFDFVPDADGLKQFKELKIDNKMKEKDGFKFIRFTQKERQANGKLNFPITVVDARNRPWDPQIVDGKVNNPIGNESIVEVKYKVVPYPGKPTGVYPQAIRVLELKPYVRQEFAPLPEDNPYVHNFADVEVEEDLVDANYEPLDEGDPLEG